MSSALPQTPDSANSGSGTTRRPNLASGKITYDNVTAMIGTRREAMLERRTIPPSTRFERRDANTIIEGNPIQVVVPTDEHGFQLDSTALERILYNPRVRDRKVAILSLAGEVRSGKSFLLNCIIRYLKSQGATNWLTKDANIEINGFASSGGTDRVTLGIYLWSEPFLFRAADGDEVALLLMDTQGAFDCNTTIMECTTIFALSFLLSSMQVYNLPTSMTEHDLQHLQLFAAYGRLAMNEIGSEIKPFQHLLFLIRDWPYPYQFPFGANGGQMLMEKRLKTFRGQHPTLKSLREDLSSCFTELACFLLPHPGLASVTQQNFTGKPSELEDDFKFSLSQLMLVLFGEGQLIVKEVNGTQITGKDLVQYFKVYVETFKNGQLPQPVSILQATADADTQAAYFSARDLYINEMEKLCKSDLPFVESNKLSAHHKVCKELAIKHFQARQLLKIGKKQKRSDKLERLLVDIESLYESFRKINSSKIPLVTVDDLRTPAVLLATIVVGFIFSSVFSLLWLTPVSIVLNVFSYLVVILLVSWCCLRYAGGSEDVITAIDEIAHFLFRLFFAPVWASITRKHKEQDRRNSIKAAEVVSATDNSELESNTDGPPLTLAENFSAQSTTITSSTAATSESTIPESKLSNSLELQSSLRNSPAVTFLVPITTSAESEASTSMPVVAEWSGSLEQASTELTQLDQDMPSAFGSRESAVLNGSRQPVQQAVNDKKNA